MDALIDKVYPNISSQAHLCDRKYLSERAILAVTNHDVNQMNSRILKRMPGALKIYWSHDRAINKENNELYPPEYFYTCNEPSLPPYQLEVKVGVPIILLQNLNPLKLCNRTRIMPTRCGKNIFEGEIMGGIYDGEKVLLSKTRLLSKENNPRCPVPYVRTQYLIRTAAASTVNKSQGQSMDTIGINLQARQIFSHGQLYVALSRVTKQVNLHIIGPTTNEYTNERWMKNVVYKQMLLRP